MRVWLIGTTILDFFDQPGLEEAVDPWYPENWCDDASALAEFAGRACYQSWDRPNAATRANRDYLRHILEIQHESVLEHNSYTFYCVGVSRSLTHELIRHRHLSFSELSQRYVGMQDADVVRPPLVKEEEWTMVEDLFQSDVCDTYVALDSVLRLQGASRKEARGAARAVLPESTETRIVVSGNARAWREMIQKRNSAAADAEIRQLAGEILGKLKSHSPGLFQDMEVWKA